MQAAHGGQHQWTVYASIALALLLAQQERYEEVASLCHFDTDLGPQIPETREDGRSLVRLLGERGVLAETARAVEQRVLGGS